MTLHELLDCNYGADGADALCRMLDGGADLNRKEGPLLETPLHVAGRNGTEAVELLIRNGADLTAPGLDSGTPLHQAAWFGQPENARLLIDAGAPLDGFDATHQSSPIGWAVHGSRYSGGAEERQGAYVALVRMMLDAGSSLRYPGDSTGDAYARRLLDDASPEVAEILGEQTP